MIGIQTVAALVLSSAIGQSQTLTQVDAKIESVGLFKNGLVLVRRTFEAPTSGTYIVRKIPQPVLGTFWIDSESDVMARVRLATGTATPAQLSGKTVTLFFKETTRESVSGTVTGFGNMLGESRSSDGEDSMIVLRTEEGQRYLKIAEIVRIEFEDATIPPLQLAAEFRLAITHTNAEAVPVQLSYVDRGVYWRPTYRLDMVDDSQLSVEQRATIRNNLAPLADAEIQVITGAPNVMFDGHVEELFRGVPTEVVPGTGVNLGGALRGTGVGGALGGGNQGQGGLGGGGAFGGFGGGGLGGGGGGNAEPNQQTNLVGPDPVVMQDGVDLHYHPIGKHSLDLGEVISLRTEKKNTQYERVVEWFPTGTDVQGEPVGDANAPWDAVRFKNPFEFPLTTGPVLFSYQNRFQGQAQLYFTSPGEPVTLRVTKALSILTEATNAVEKSEPVKLTLFGKDYWKRIHQTRLWIHNLRSTKVPVTVRRQFDGELIEAEGEPEKKGQPAPNKTSNPVTQLAWKFDLGPGEEKTLTFRYSTISER